MRTVFIILVLSTSTICFVGGYKLGQSNPLVTVRQEIPAAEKVEAYLAGNVVAVIEAPLEPERVNEAARPDAAHLRRAAQSTTTFTDTQGRKLVAAVLEVQADSLKVRRQADSLTVMLPVAMLCEEDQAFAAYLLKVKPPKVAPPVSMEDKIWDELFR